MNRFKDFLYNKNDIIIVLIILLAAGFIIYTRIDAIMDYPEALAEKSAKEQSEQMETQTEATQASESGSSESASSTAAETVSITITDSDTSSSVADKLYEAGLVSSADEFESATNSAGKASSIKSGTFQITKGATNEEILNIIAN